MWGGLTKAHKRDGAQRFVPPRTVFGRGEYSLIDGGMVTMDYSGKLSLTSLTYRFCSPTLRYGIDVDGEQIDEGLCASPGRCPELPLSPGRPGSFPISEGRVSLRGSQSRL